MAIVHLKLPHHQYSIVIEPGALDRLGEIVRPLAPHSHCALLGDVQVTKVHGPRAEGSLRAAGYEVVAAVIPPGERFKTLDTVRQMYDVLLDARLERRSPVVALGGGVTGDTVGFIAASYLRGVPFVQVPTSLLAMVDASVGGKVGVNVPQGKNLIGAFYQPIVVVIDPLVLQTLPLRELRCGLAECIKHAVIRDPSLLAFITDRWPAMQAHDPATLVELVQRNVAIKAAVVMEDEKEQSVRAHLNYGHTFGHAIEATTHYAQFLHGEAVALGMVAAAHAALALGLCHADVLHRITAALDIVGLPTRADLPPTPDLMDAMLLDKKVKDHRIRFILPTELGHVVIRDDVPPATVASAWDAIRR
jgi:3-dehydroquinate synthase